MEIRADEISRIIRDHIQGADTKTSVLETGTMLTVGDGLVSQIPALIVSTAAGIIVTKVSTDVNLGNQIKAQFLMSLNKILEILFLSFCRIPVGIISIIVISCNGKYPIRGFQLVENGYIVCNLLSGVIDQITGKKYYIRLFSL